jgi:thioredoxin-like negative regulator of GroEL
MTYLSTNEYEELVASADSVIVSLSAPWCGPCTALWNALNTMPERYAGLQVARVNIDESPTVAMQYQVQAVPTIQYWKAGELVHTVKGARPATQMAEEFGLER